MRMILGKKTTLLIATTAFIAMFIITMFVVNPAIDGKTGADLLKLQLAFDKNLGVQIIDQWGTKGIAVFNRWAFVDNVYALSYAFFLASVASMLILRSPDAINSSLSKIPWIAFMAGGLDGLENLMQYNFIQAPNEYSSTLFFLHSVVATMKWLCIFITIIALIQLFRSMKKS